MIFGSRVCRCASAAAIWYAQRATSAELYTWGSIVARVTRVRRSPPVAASMATNGTSPAPGRGTRPAP